MALMDAADKAVPNADIPLRWRLTHLFIRWIVFGTASRALASRTLTDNEGNSLRWLQPEIDQFVNAVESEAEIVHPIAKLETLPSFGNRPMVEHAVYTAACDWALRRQGVTPACARQAVADLGWDIYRRMLAPSSPPARLVTRDPSAVRLAIPDRGGVPVSTGRRGYRGGGPGAASFRPTGRRDSRCRSQNRPQGPIRPLTGLRAACIRPGLNA